MGFSLIKHPAMGVPHDYGNPHMEATLQASEGSACVGLQCQHVQERDHLFKRMPLTDCWNDTDNVLLEILGMYLHPPGRKRERFTSLSFLQIDETARTWYSNTSNICGRKLGSSSSQISDLKRTALLLRFSSDVRLRCLFGHLHLAPARSPEWLKCVHQSHLPKELQLP